MHIITYPSDILRAKSTAVENFDHSLRATVAAMIDTMYTNNGVGLAAPQIGINERLIVVDPTSGQSAHSLIVMVNPKIMWSSDDVETKSEGCLSVPGIILGVCRNSEIEVEYSDMSGTQHYGLYSGLTARIIQHEIDHLDGVLLVDRASPVEHRVALKKLSKIAIGLLCQQEINCLGFN